MITAVKRQDRIEVQGQLHNPMWRLNNLYWIIDEHSNCVKFQMRPMQRKFWDDLHFRNVILKSRQHGFTTEIDLMILDHCLFNENIRAGIIAHTQKDAQSIFYDKIKYPFYHLPEALREALKGDKDDGGEMRFSNNSHIRVATSLRSANLHCLHISEYGKICAKFPNKALELKTGTLPTVHEGAHVFVESTAEGGAGDFYDMATRAQSETVRAEQEERLLGKIEYKFHFFAWFDNPMNATNPLGVQYRPELLEYFSKLERKGVKLAAAQKAWYSITRDGPGGLGATMLREHPSTAEEAFEQSVQGAVYGTELEEARAEGRIGSWPWDQSAKVYTGWDLGYADSTVCLFVQFIGAEIRIIDEYGKAGRGAAYHAAQVLAKPYIYSKDAHAAPHDVAQHEKGSGIMLRDTYAGLGIDFHKTERPETKAVGIDEVRQIFNHITIDERKCPNLVRALAYYRYEWLEDRVCFSDKPIHDGSSHWCDALQTIALRYRYAPIDGQMVGYPHPLRYAPVDERTAWGGRQQKEVW